LEKISTACQDNSPQAESPIQVLETRLTFHQLAQRNAFRCRGARQQSRSFARENQWLRHSPNSNALGIVDRLRRGFAEFKLRAHFLQARGKSINLLLLFGSVARVATALEACGFNQLNQFFDRSRL
jgi:hypothetical protein